MHVQKTLAREGSGVVVGCPRKARTSTVYIYAISQACFCVCTHDALRVSARACVGKVGAGTVEEAEENAQMLLDEADRRGGFVLLSARADISSPRIQTGRESPTVRFGVSSVQLLAGGMCEPILPCGFMLSRLEVGG